MVEQSSVAPSGHLAVVTNLCARLPAIDQILRIVGEMDQRKNSSHRYGRTRRKELRYVTDDGVCYTRRAAEGAICVVLQFPIPPILSKALPSPSPPRRKPEIPPYEPKLKAPSGRERNESPRLNCPVFQATPITYSEPFVGAVAFVPCRREPSQEYPSLNSTGLRRCWPVPMKSRLMTNQSRKLQFSLLVS